MSQSSSRAIGIDAAPKGWVAIVLTDGGFDEARLVPELAQLDDLLGPDDIVAIDIPIGHVESGKRQADVLARQRLGRRASTVFSAPPPEVLDCADYEEANALSNRRFGVGLSRQAWGLRDSILDAARFAEAASCRVVEAHPELSFSEMAGETVGTAKKTWAGLHRRRELLAVEGIVIPDDLGNAGAAGPDDVLDAAAVAWTAQRVLKEVAEPIPDPPEAGLKGEPVAIWS